MYYAFTLATVAPPTPSSACTDTIISRIAGKCIFLGRNEEDRTVTPLELTTLGPEVCCSWTGFTRYDHKDPQINVAGKRIRVRAYLYRHHHKQLFHEDGDSTYNKQVLSTCDPVTVCVNPHHLYLKPDRHRPSSAEDAQEEVAWLSRRNIMLASIVSSSRCHTGRRRKPLAIPTHKLRALFKAKKHTSIAQRLLCRQ